jgi:hypothetical protein
LSRGRARRLSRGGARRLSRSARRVARGNRVVRLELQRRTRTTGDAQELERIALVHLAEHGDRLGVGGSPGRGACLGAARPEAERQARAIGGRWPLEVVDEPGGRFGFVVRTIVELG